MLLKQEGRCNIWVNINVYGVPKYNSPTNTNDSNNETSESQVEWRTTIYSNFILEPKFIEMFHKCIFIFQFECFEDYIQSCRRDWFYSLPFAVILPPATSPFLSIAYMFIFFNFLRVEICLASLFVGLNKIRLPQVLVGLIGLIHYNKMESPCFSRIKKIVSHPRMYGSKNKK